VKRVFVAVGLLLTIALGCLWSITTQGRAVDQLTARTEQMERLFLAGDTDGAAREAAALHREYRRHLNAFTLFLPHETLTEVERSVVSLPAILEKGEPKDFLGEVRRCRLLLSKMMDLERPTLQNIL
jgi:hypothetical protein